MTRLGLIRFKQAISVLLGGLSAAILLLVSAPATADEINDVNFVIEFAALADMIEDFGKRSDQANQSLIDFIDSVSKKDSFKGQRSFSGPLKAAAEIYDGIATEAAATFVADPRNSDMVESFENMALSYAELFPKLAKCARTGRRPQCLRVIKALEDGPNFDDAVSVTSRVADEANTIITGFEAKYGSFQAARDAVLNGGDVAQETPSQQATAPQKDAGPQIMFDIETALSLLGFDPGPIDGKFDSRSQKALTALIAMSEGVFPEGDPQGLLQQLKVLMQDAKEYPEDRNWGDNPDLNRRLADATGYLGSFDGRGFRNWVDRQPKSLGLARAVRAIKRTYRKQKPSGKAAPERISSAQVFATLNAPVAPLDPCDTFAADTDDKAALSRGVSLVDLDVARAIEACEAALRATPAEARFSFQLARAYLSAGKTAKARQIFTALAAGNHMPSIAHLGYIDYFGLDDVGDKASARLYLTRAAESSDRALNILVGMLRRGDGGAKDPKEAIRWLHLGIARKPDAKKYEVLASMYANGEGVEKNEVTAAQYREKARLLLQPSAVTRLVKPENDPPQTSYEAPAPTVLVPNSVIAPNTAPQIEFAGLPPQGQHWLAVSAPGLAGKQYYFLEMLVPGQTDGVITGPDLPVGKYEARLFLNWPEGEYRIVDTAEIEVLADYDLTLRRRQILAELATLLSVIDAPELKAKLETAQSGEKANVAVLANALLVRASEFAVVSAELSEVAPLEAALELVRYAVELMPEDPETIRAAGIFYLRTPPEAGLIYDAESLLEYAVSLDAGDRLARTSWLEALAQLSRYDAAEKQLLTLWPPQPGEGRLVGLVGDLYLARGDAKRGLQMLEAPLPDGLADAANLARATLQFALGQKAEAVQLVQALSQSADPYYAAIGRNMTPPKTAPGPAAPLRPPKN
ncbi:MAG: hypothetical protein GXP03_05850 [Alphaproteobacteria bacterium]|nr:hypothetical protein [Alphaproteobacteria bacterium]